MSNNNRAQIAHFWLILTTVSHVSFWRVNFLPSFDLFSRQRNTICLSFLNVKKERRLGSTTGISFKIENKADFKPVSWPGLRVTLPVKRHNEGARVRLQMSNLQALSLSCWFLNYYFIAISYVTFCLLGSL